VKQEYSKGLKDCDKAISIRFSCAKAHFRKATILKKMEDWRSALATVEDGIKVAPEDPSFQREKEAILAKIKEIKSHFLKNMVVKDIPDEQKFIKITVRDDTESMEQPAPTSKPARSSISSQSTAAGDQPTSHPTSQKNSTTNDRSQIQDGLSEFIHLKNIDGEKMKKADNQEAAQTEVVETKTRRVRFTIPTEKDIRNAKPVGLKRNSKPPSHSCLKKGSKCKYSAAALGFQPTASTLNHSTAPATLLIPHDLLEAYKKRLSAMTTPSQFEDFWRSFKQEPETKEWLLRELKPDGLERVFKKGIEFEIFIQVFSLIL
jgi:hypothetical protein